MQFPWSDLNTFYNLLFVGHFEKSTTWELFLIMLAFLNCSEPNSKEWWVFWYGPYSRGTYSWKRRGKLNRGICSPSDGKCIHHYSYQVKSLFLLPFYRLQPLPTVLQNLICQTILPTILKCPSILCPTDLGIRDTNLLEQPNLNTNNEGGRMCNLNINSDAKYKSYLLPSPFKRLLWFNVFWSIKAKTKKREGGPNFYSKTHFPEDYKQYEHRVLVVATLWCTWFLLDPSCERTVSITS